MYNKIICLTFILIFNSVFSSQFGWIDDNEIDKEEENLYKNYEYAKKKASPIKLDAETEEFSINEYPKLIIVTFKNNIFYSFVQKKHSSPLAQAYAAQTKINQSSLPPFHQRRRSQPHLSVDNSSPTMQNCKSDTSTSERRKSDSHNHSSLIIKALHSVEKLQQTQNKSQEIFNKAQKDAEEKRLRERQQEEARILREQQEDARRLREEQIEKTRIETEARQKKEDDERKLRREQEAQIQVEKRKLAEQEKARIEAETRRLRKQQKDARDQEEARRLREQQIEKVRAEARAKAEQDLNAKIEAYNQRIREQIRARTAQKHQKWSQHFKREEEKTRRDQEAQEKRTQEARERGQQQIKSGQVIIEEEKKSEEEKIIKARAGNASSFSFNDSAPSVTPTTTTTTTGRMDANTDRNMQPNRHQEQLKIAENLRKLQQEENKSNSKNPTQISSNNSFMKAFLGFFGALIIYKIWENNFTKNKEDTDKSKSEDNKSKAN